MSWKKWVIAAAMLGTASTYARHSAPATDAGTGGTTQQQEQEAAMPSEWSKPSRLLSQARSEVSHDADTAARHIDEAAGILAKDAKEAEGSTRAELDQASQDLTKTAQQVRNEGSNYNPQSLEQPFAQSYSALSSWYQNLAQEQWSKRASRDAGESLRASAHYLERAAAESGRSSDQAIQATVRNSREVADQLEAGAGTVPQNVENAISGVGNQATRLGRRVLPTR